MTETVDLPAPVVEVTTEGCEVHSPSSHRTASTPASELSSIEAVKGFKIANLGVSKENARAKAATLSLVEQISLLRAADHWRTVAIPNKGIANIKTSDGPNGACGAVFKAGTRAALFPCGVSLAATWDTKLLYEVGQHLGEETKARSAHVLLAPTVCLHRGPFGGRNFESFSEDPLLTGKLAASYINGLQQKGIPYGAFKESRALTGEGGVTIEFYTGDKFEGEPNGCPNKNKHGSYAVGLCAYGGRECLVCLCQGKAYAQDTGKHKFSFFSVGPGRLYIDEDVVVKIELETGRTYELMWELTNEIRPLLNQMAIGCTHGPGGVDGAEVVQGNVHDVKSRLVRPEKELAVFDKVFLEAGETKDVVLTLDKLSVGYYDTRLKAWIAEEGEFKILVGSTSADIRQSATFDVAESFTWIF
ncbi:hypothetical protein VC83_07542 [Pseudogymnoascus destructans]|uniref:beta-glucosidase n=1 Tax=Pseudogymnoascus destructans TaxID=655981 RepID=A0A177A4Q7_9PEZI|nr:uncharacterized protein VC83_07542 [Pseudogymnoascus destructans]OAF56221.1 hypothetical protein VC83_07542 [Pseudogymnoascus destructans]